MPPKHVLSVPLRLTRAEMEIICRGLNPLERDYLLWKEHGYGAFPNLTLRQIDSVRCHDDLIDQHGAMVSELGGLVCGNSQPTKRVHLNAIELAACQLGVRLVVHRDRRKKVKWNRRNHRATMRHLSLKLENARKIARSVHIRARGEADYILARDRWQTCVAWMREVFAYAFLRHSKRIPFGRNTTRKLVIRDWLIWVQQALIKLELEPIPEGEIVGEVRQALYAARRAGIGFGVLDPRLSTSRTEWFINELVRRIFEPAWVKKHNGAPEDLPVLSIGGTDEDKRNA